MQENLRKVFVTLLCMAMFVAFPFTETQGADISADERLLSEDVCSFSDEALDAILREASLSVTGQWLAMLSEEELKGIVARDTILSEHTVIKEYELASDEEADEHTVTMTKECKYYEWALENAAEGVRQTERMSKDNTEESVTAEDVTAESATSKASGHYFSGTGKCHLMIYKDGTKQQITFDITNIDGKQANTSRTYNVAMTGAEGSGVTLSDTQRSTRNKLYYTKSQVEANPSLDDGSSYKWFTIGLNYTKPIGYKAQGVVEQYAGGTSPNIVMDDGVNVIQSNVTYSQNCFTTATNNVICLKSIYNNFGIGLEDETGKNVSSNESVKGVFAIHLTRPSFTIAYNGNGATSGSVAAQTHYWDETSIALPGNGYTREYLINFDGNGGETNSSSTKEIWAFTGWGSSPTGGVTNGVGGSYVPTAFTSSENAVVNYYAIWKAGTTTLPSVSRTGYKFTGWYNGNVSVGEQGSVVTFGKNTNLVANWKANTYTICYMSDGKQVGSQQISYDMTKNLNTADNLKLEKQGYVFDGWKSETGSFADGQAVKNLATNGIVTLNAVWKEATDTPYQVVSKFQKAIGSDEYIADETKTRILKGTTGSTVSVVPEDEEGYVTPKIQQTVISADGSSVVTFLYKLKDTSLDERKEDGMSQGQEAPKKVIQEQMNEITKLIAGGLSFKLEVDGVNYEMVKLDDGTFSVRFAGTDQKEVTIPNIIKIGENTYYVSEVYEKAFCGNKDIETVTVSKGISKIARSAFEGCSALKKVIFNDGLTEIRENAFKNCVSLEKVCFPQSLHTIGTGAFQNCTKLNTVIFNENLLKIGSSAFKNCVSLTSIKIPNSVLVIGGSTFEECKKLKKVSISQQDSLCYSMGASVFKNCVSLTGIRLPDKLTKIPKKGFYGCSKLKTAKIGAGTTSVGASAFEGCKRMTSVTIPANVRSIQTKAFYKCSKLKKVTMKGKVLTSVGKKAFQKCKKGIQFKVPSKKLNSYQKLLKGKYTT